MSTSAAESAPVLPGTNSAVTAFERRFGHPPGLAILFFTQMWERSSYFGMRGLLKLYMVNYLFITLRQTIQGGPYVETGDPGAVMGWRALQDVLPRVEPEVLERCVGETMPRLLEGDARAHLAPLTSEAARSIAEQTCAARPHASMVYGLLMGLVFLTPLLGGILADRLFGQRRMVIGGAALLMVGYFALAFEGSFFLALGLVILGTGAFRPNITAQVGDLYRDGDPRRDGGFTLFYMGLNLGAVLANVGCGALAVVYGWHHGFAAAGVGMGLGLTVYVLGRGYLAKDAHGRAERSMPASAAPAPVATRRGTLVGIFMVLCLLNVLFSAILEQHSAAMVALTTQQTSSASGPGSSGSLMLLTGLGPLCLLLFAPLLDLVWRRQAKVGKEKASVLKMAAGCLLVSVSCLALIFVAGPTGSGEGGLFWPMLCAVLLALGELCFVPITLSLLTRIAPLRLVSTMIGILMVSDVLGNMLSSYLGIFAGTLSIEVFSLMLAVIVAGAGAVLLVCRKPIERASGAGN